MPQNRTKTKPGKLRIIGGEWRSRLLAVADLPGLRPTTDRVRETLFNWLQNYLPGASCLDLFAGSGALGFEAASRGCKSVLMFELQAEAAAILAANIKTLQADKIQLLQQDVMHWLKTADKQSVVTAPFDIVFLDPPFASDYLATACQLLEQQQLLSEFACIYIETDSGQPLPELPASWHVVRQKKAGQVSYYLLRRNFTDS